MTYNLLSVARDSKTRKSIAHGYLTGVLYLAPADEAGVGNMCTKSTQQCRDACLYGAGMAGVFPSIKRARIRKTRLYKSDPEQFKSQLREDIAKLILEANYRDLIPVVRINGTSDDAKLARAMAEEFSTVQFYDYTKLPKPWNRTLSNYHLTFSFSGDNLSSCLACLTAGINVAVVFKGELPISWHGWPVVNGDQSDLRFLDPRGVIVGLKAKGPARKMPTGGFIQIGTGGGR